MSTFLTLKDQILHYAATHRLTVYAAAAVAIFVAIALLRFVSARAERNASLNSSLTAPGHASSVTAINEAPVTRCTHCDESLSSRRDFCPSCGYAQPAQPTGTAARFPG